MYRIGFISLGCPKNQVDAERMLAKLDAAGMEITDYLDGADAVIINTCAFIDEAKAEAIENILEMAELKQQGLVKKIIVTGCLPQRYQDEVFTEIPEVDAVIGIGANADIVALVREVMGDEAVSVYPSPCDLPLTGERVLTTPEYWAYLKIADGCSNCCSYCAIPGIRGPFRSAPMEDLLNEAQVLVANGVKELILIAQDTTNYGADLYGEPKLPELLEKLCEIEGLAWIRLLYCYPDKLTQELLDVMAAHEQILHYIDLPLQHCNDAVLAAMNRSGDKQKICETIARIRKTLPDAVIRTAFIVGFPGESEEAFEELAEFVNEMEFDRMGCFRFSAQEGTPAFDLVQTVEEEVKQRRGEILMQDQYDIMQEKNGAHIGQSYRVLVEEYAPYTDSYRGRSYMDAPEIDTCIIFTGKGDYQPGSFVNVHIFAVKEYDLLGEVLSED